MRRSIGVALVVATLVLGGASPTRADEPDAASWEEFAERLEASRMESARSVWADTDTDSLVAFAHIYEGPGVMQDVAMAVLAYRVAAERGHVLAYVPLGRMYRLGRGVKKDYFEAASWFRKAAELGNAAGQTELGALYFLGIGVPHDYVEATRLFRAAALQGDAAAQARLGMAYAAGKGVEQDLPRPSSGCSLRKNKDLPMPHLASAACTRGESESRRISSRQSTGIERRPNRAMKKRWSAS